MKETAYSCVNRNWRCAPEIHKQQGTFDLPMDNGMFDRFAVKAICWDEDHVDRWYVDLVATDFLVLRLRGNFMEQDRARSLCLNPRPEFYVTYYVTRRFVSCFSRCYYTENGRRFYTVEDLLLSDDEIGTLMKVIEASCRELFDGKDCLVMLNEYREKRGMRALKGVQHF